jgi:uncharacterized phiE125 gp8 family phage protein
MALTLTTAPAAEPVTTAVAKSHLRVDLSTDDTLIDALILAAREMAEEYTRRALINQTWTWNLDRFPASSNDALLVPKAPLSSVSSIAYIDNEGDSQTWSSALYDVTTPAGPRCERGRIAPAYGEIWPTTRAQMDAVTITFVAGYGTASTDLPGPVIQAIQLIIGRLYEHREDVIVGQPAAMLPRGAESMLFGYRLGLD